MSVVIPGVKGTVEYVEETSFGVFPTDPTMQWIGLVTKAKPILNAKSATVRYLPESGASNRAEALKNVKVGEEVGFEIEYHPQAFPGFLQYWLGSTAGLADTLKSIPIGLINEEDSEYQTLSGLVGEEATLSIPEEGPIAISGRFVGADATDPGASDYIGLGSHATADTSDPLTSEDVSSIQMDYGSGFVSVEDVVKSIEISISNKLGIAKDLNATTSTRIKGIVLLTREVKLSLEMDYDDLDMLTYVRSYNELKFKFTLGTKVITLEGVRFPEMPYEFGPDDLVGDKLTSDPVTKLTIA